MKITKSSFSLATPRDTLDLSSKAESTAIPLPDIKEVLRKKEVEEELARIEEEQAETKVKIKRNDKKALAKVTLILMS